MMRGLGTSVQQALATVLVLGSVAAFSAVRAQTAEVVDLPVRDGAMQRILVLSPAGLPGGVVLLYVGGSGNIKLKPDGTIRKDGNFLVRSRDLFVKQGFLTVLVDRPTDWAGSDSDRYRTTTAHANDAKAILRFVRHRTQTPVWLVGNSRGTISAAHIALALGPSEVGGIVLSAAVTRPGGRRTRMVQDIDLSRITVPVLLLGHKDDGCAVTPWADQAALAAAFTSSPRAEAVGLKGGEHGDPSEPCRGYSHHGFLSLEARAVETIADWIAAASG